MQANWFAGRLRELRKGAKLTQAELAEKSGVSQATIAQLETGRRQPEWGTVIALCVALVVDPGAFATAPKDVSVAKPGRPAKVTPATALADPTAGTTEPPERKKKGKQERK